MKAMLHLVEVACILSNRRSLPFGLLCMHLFHATSWYPFITASCSAPTRLPQQAPEVRRQFLGGEFLGLGMDPLSIASASGSIALVCIRLSKQIYTWVNQTKDIDEEVQTFGTEVVAYSRVLGAIDQNLRRPAIAEAVRTSEGEFWSHVKRSLDDCSETLARLEKVLGKVGGATTNPFAKVAKNVKFGLVFDKITTLRRQINTYHSTMQLALQMCLVSQNLNNEALHETLETKIDRILKDTQDIRSHINTRSIAARLPTQDSAVSMSPPSLDSCTISKQENEADLEFETKVYDHITEVLETAKSIASIAAQSDTASVTGSVVSLSDATYIAIENWIWSQDGPSMSAWAKMETKMPAKSRRLGIFDSRNGYQVDNLHFLCNEVDALCEQEVTRPVAASLLVSFFKRWEQACNTDDFLKQSLQYIADAIKQPKNGGGILALTKSGFSILHLVAIFNQVDFLGILVQRGAEVEAGTGRLGTPLHFAAKFDSAQAVLFLLDQGANADALDAGGMTPFMGACSYGQETTAGILINRTSDVMLQCEGSKATALHFSIEKKLDLTAKLIITAAQNVDIPDALGITPLLRACDSRDRLSTSPQVIELLLDRGASVNASGLNGETAISLACMGGQRWLVQELLQRGASLQQDHQHFNQTPIYHACQHADVATLTLLLDFGASINSSKYPIENALLAAAWQKKSADTARVLIQSDSVHFILAKTADDERAIHIACQLALPSVTVQWLVDAMEDKNVVDKHGRSALHHAVIGGNADLIKLLLEAGVKYTLKTEEGQTALDAAVKTKKTDAAFAIIEWTAQKENNLLHTASAIDDEAVFSKTLEKCLNSDWVIMRLGNHPASSLNKANKEGEYPLHIATRCGIIYNMTLLLDAGADINVQHKKTGDTPLHFAARAKWLGGMAYLLKRGADPNIEDSHGLVPAQYNWLKKTATAPSESPKSNVGILRETWISPPKLIDNRDIDRPKTKKERSPKPNSSGNSPAMSRLGSAASKKDQKSTTKKGREKTKSPFAKLRAGIKNRYYL